MFDNEDIDFELYSQYFGNNNKQETNKKVTCEDTHTCEQKGYRFVSDGNINSVEKAMEAVKFLLDATFNNKRIGFGQEYNSGESVMPYISYSTIERTPSEKTPLNSNMYETRKEIIDGKHTGDSFQIHAQFFDCIVEFNFFATSTTEASELKNKFEETMQIYTGSLKRAGITHIYFIKEINPSHSTKAEYNPLVTLVYYFEVQRVYAIRTSTLKSVNTEVVLKVQEHNPDLNDILDDLASFNKLQ